MIHTYLHHQLVGASDEREAVVVVELFRNVLSKGVSSPARGDAPTTPVVRVRPQEIAHGTLGMCICVGVGIGVGVRICV